MVQATKILEAEARRRSAVHDGAASLSTDGDDAAECLFELARALHVAGASSSRVEATFRDAARRLGLRAEVLSTPTSLLVAFGRAGERGLRMARVEPGDVHLGRLAAVDALVEDFEQGQVDAAEARRRLRTIEARPAGIPLGLDLAAAAAASGTAAFFFGGSPLDGGLAGGLGAAIALLGRAAAGGEHRRPLFEPAAACAASGLATAAARAGVPLDVQAVTLSALIALVPGYALTIAMSELAARHLVSGVARLAAAAGTLLGMALGVALGRALGRAVPERLAGVPHAGLGELGVWIAVGVGSLAFAALFRARPRDVPAIVAASSLAFVGGRLGTAWLGPEVGGFVGALVLGLVGNATARLTRRPASTVLVPGLMVLVPGSVGFRSVAQFLDADAVSGVDTAFRAVLVATSLVGGLLAAGLALPPRRSV